MPRRMLGWMSGCHPRLLPLPKFLPEDDGSFWLIQIMAQDFYRALRQPPPPHLPLPLPPGKVLYSVSDMAVNAEPIHKRPTNSKTIAPWAKQSCQADWQTFS